MLGKLIKYDLQNLFKQCLPLYLVGIALTVLNGAVMIPLMLSGDAYYYSGILSFFMAMLPTVSIIFVATLSFMAAFLVCKNFMNTVFGKGGYLTNTLPVSEHQIVLGKVISGTIVLAVTGLISSLCGILYLIMLNAMEIPYIDWSIIPTSMLVSVPAIALITLVSTLVLVYACIALGHLSKHKIVASVLWYLVITNFVIQPLQYFVTSVMFEDMATGYAVSYSAMGVMNSFLSMSWAITAVSAIISLIGYFAIIKIMKTRLNLV